LGHVGVTSYLDFTQRLIKRFDTKDREIHFREIAQLKQTSSLEAYISQFQRVDVMVSDISEVLLVMLFVEGLMETLWGWVKAYKPTSLQDVVSRARDMQYEVPKIRFLPKPIVTLKTKEIRLPQRDWANKPKLDEETKRELRKKKLCFSCQEPWEPGHICVEKDGMGKAHYIEVYSNSDNDADEEVEQAQDQGNLASGEESSQDRTKDPFMASMLGFLRYHTFRVKGVLQGHKVTILIDGGESHKFIDGNMVERRGISTEEFDGFIVVILGGHQMIFTKWIPKLTTTMGNYSMTDDLFMMDIPDTNVVLGVQWIYSIGRYTTDQRTMDMEFIGSYGKKVVLRAMRQYPPKIVSSHNMEAIMRHGDIEWVVESFISDRDPPDRLQQLREDLQVLLRKHHKVFSDIPPGIPLDRGFEHIIELEEGV
jgi:hypothetical protein